MRLGEFFEALQAHNYEKEMDRRHMGELARGAALRLFNLQLKPKDRITDPAKFWAMPWDEDTRRDEADEVQRLNGLSAEESFREAQKFLAKFKDNGNSDNEPEI